MVIRNPKKGKPKEIAKNQEPSNNKVKSDVMSDSLYKFLSNLSKSMKTNFDKNVFFTIKKYKIKYIYPSHPNNSDDPTDILIFCLRWVVNNKFQPIGGILFKPEEYTGCDSKLGKTLGELIKAYLWSIHMLSFNVVGIISPPDDYFKSIIRYLTKSQDFETGENPIVFFSEQFNNIPCLYDPESVQLNFQKGFRQYDVAYFLNNNEKSATWKNLEILLKLYDMEISNTKNLFTFDVYNSLLLNINNEKFEDPCGTASLMSSLRVFLKYMETNLFQLGKISDLNADWDFVVEMLETMEYKENITEISESPKPLFKVSLLNNEIKQVDDVESNVNNFTINNSDKKSEKENIDVKKEKNKPYSRKSKKKKSKHEKKDEASSVEQTKLLMDLHRNVGTIKEEKSPRNKTSPYSRPQKDSKNQLSSFSGLEKGINLPKIEEDLSSLLESVKEQISSWSDNDSFESSSSSSSGKTTNSCNSLNVSLKECTNLINKIKIDSPKVVNRDAPILEYKSAIKSMKFAVNKLIQCKLFTFYFSSFNCNHTDYYVNIIKKDINQLPVPDNYITNSKCTLYDKNQAILTLDKESGNLFCLKQ